MIYRLYHGIPQGPDEGPRRWQNGYSQPLEEVSSSLCASGSAPAFPSLAVLRSPVMTLPDPIPEDRPGVPAEDTASRAAARQQREERNREQRGAASRERRGAASKRGAERREHGGAKSRDEQRSSPVSSQ